MKLGRKLAEWLVYYQSAGKYVGLVNFVLLVATVKEAYDIRMSALTVVPIALLGVMLIGVIDYRYVMRHQLAFTNEQNNLLSEVRELKRLIKEART